MPQQFMSRQDSRADLAPSYRDAMTAASGSNRSLQCITSDAAVEQFDAFAFNLLTTALHMIF